MNNMKPVYLLAGGRYTVRPTPDPLLEAVFKESGVPSPTIVYVGTANNDMPDFFDRVAGMFREAGSGKVTHAIITPAKADLEKAKTILKSADIIFISGGDVERGMQVLQEKNTVKFLQELYRQGKPFFGLSAGSIMLAKEWVRWTDPEDDTTAEIFPCLNIAPVLCDTHGEQDGWEELQALLGLEPDDTIGYGIVSGTAIKVFPDGKVEALGGSCHRFIKHGDKVERLPDLVPRG
jgi:peptidase E